MGLKSRFSPLGGAGGVKTSGLFRLGINTPVPTPRARPAAKSTEGPMVGMVREDERWFQNLSGNATDFLDFLILTKSSSCT